MLILKIWDDEQGPLKMEEPPFWPLKFKPLFLWVY